MIMLCYCCIRVLLVLFRVRGKKAYRTYSFLVGVVRTTVRSAYAGYAVVADHRSITLRHVRLMVMLSPSLTTCYPNKQKGLVQRKLFPFWFVARSRYTVLIQPCGSKGYVQHLQGCGHVGVRETEPRSNLTEQGLMRGVVDGCPALRPQGGRDEAAMQCHRLNLPPFLLPLPLPLPLLHRRLLLLRLKRPNANHTLLVVSGTALVRFATQCRRTR